MAATDPNWQFPLFTQHVKEEVKSPERLSIVSLQYGVCKQTRDGHILLQLRPVRMVETKWIEVFAFLDHDASTHNGARKHDKAPPGPLTRELNQHQQRPPFDKAQGKKGGKKGEREK